MSIITLQNWLELKTKMKIHIIILTLLISASAFAGEQAGILSMQERAEVIVERDPQKIGVNFSGHWGLADGVSL